MFHESITPQQASLIENSRVFFVASAAPGLEDGPDGSGPVNVSPRGGVPLKVLSPSRIAWLDYPGSGNETKRHSENGGAVTVMVCSFEAENAAIVRLYGRAKAEPVDASPLAEELLASTRAGLTATPRQVIGLDVERTQTSCGYGVPVFQFVRERQTDDRGRVYK